MSSNHDLGRGDEMNPMETDELDVLLRRWHEVNAQRAATGRAQLLMKLEQTRSIHPLAPSLQRREDRPQNIHPHPMKRYLRAAASFALLIMLAALLIPLSHSPVQAQQIMVPDGGRLDAIDRQGRIIGPCALQHTDVNIAISGPFTRVTVKQQYHNPYQSKIEAVYTFPLSHRGAVDRMSMTIGDRVIQAEMKERQQARQIYESARQAGNVASLLEQERPNIFTQSVANIEPNADVLIEISYVEMLQSKDGQYTFDFPMTVVPRYIPGYSQPGSGGGGGAWQHADAVRLPNELERRWGVILLGPATFQRVQFSVQTGSPTDGQPARVTSTLLGPAPLVQRILDAAVPILAPGPEYRARPEIQTLLRSRPEGGIDFYAHYSDGRSDFGQIAADGLGQVAGRWFYFDPAVLDRIDPNWRNTKQGIGYEADTNQVPDAGRITPAPVRPPMRAGHDISLKVSIDTGGPGIVDYKSDLHEIICTDEPKWRNAGEKINLALTNKSEIPNRDFVLHWRTMDDAIKESTFTYMPPKAVDDKGGFFTLMLAPPARVDEAAIAPRELIFVLDTSGSMSGLPIEKAKDLMVKAIQAMRSRDTFNIITFSGDTHILWDKPRSNTDANRNEALAFLTSRAGSGGTEMMTAINAALAPTNAVEQPLTPEQLSNLPADGREVFVGAVFDAIEAIVMKNAVMQPKLRVREGLAIALSSFQLPVEEIMRDPQVLMHGKWTTVNGERILQIASAQAEPPAGIGPLRIVMFLTDGQVGNDNAIIQAVKDNAKTARVFSFGVGDAPNRYLLDGMAQAGRGEVEYVNLQSNPDAAVQRFARRIGTPVLTDIKLAFSGQGVEITDTIPPLDAVPDLFDLKPLIIHGRYKTGGTGIGGTGVSPVKAKLTIHGATGAGPYERTLDLTLPAATGAGAVNGGAEGDHSVIATLWARAKVQEIMKTDLNAVQQNTPTPQMHDQIVALGEQFSIMTQYTSFVAVEKARITIGGQAMLVPVPIEFPEGEQWEGTFGNEGKPGADHNLFRLSDFFNADGTLKGPVTGGTFEPRSNGKQFGWKASAVVNANLYQLRDADGDGVTDASHWNVGMYDAVGDTGAYVVQPNPANMALGDIPVAGQAFQPATVLCESIASAGYGDFRRLNDLPALRWKGSQNSPQIGMRSPGQDGAWAAGAAVEGEPAGTDTNGGSNNPPVPNNGVVNVDDLLGVVSHWGQNPAGTQGGGGSAIASSGGTGGGGGSLFFDSGGIDQAAKAFADRPAEERQQELIDSVTELVHPEAWEDNGGDLATLTCQNNTLVFKALKDTPQAQQVIDDARAFLAYLQDRIPEIRKAAAIDAAPSAPFSKTDEIRIYDVRGLLTVQTPPDREIQQIIDLLTDFVEADSWESNGGTTSRIRALDDRLIVDTTPKNHESINRLLKTLRDALANKRPVRANVGYPVETRDSVPGNPNDSQDAGFPARKLVIYDVRDLIETGQNHAATQSPHVSDAEITQQIFDVITECINPDGWETNGGTIGSIRAWAGLLLIQNTFANHDGIARVLKELRRANGLQTADIEEAISAQALRVARLKRIIDLRLRLDMVDLSSSGGYCCFGSIDPDKTIVVLVRDTKESTLDQLRSAGLRVEDVVTSSNLVGGIIPMSKLAELALIENVRRIEPVNE